MADGSEHRTSTSTDAKHAENTTWSFFYEPATSSINARRVDVSKANGAVATAANRNAQSQMRRYNDAGVSPKQPKGRRCCRIGLRTLGLVFSIVIFCWLILTCMLATALSKAGADPNQKHPLLPSTGDVLVGTDAVSQSSYLMTQKPEAANASHPFESMERGATQAIEATQATVGRAQHGTEQQVQIARSLESSSARYFVYNRSDFSVLRKGSPHYQGHRIGAPMFVQRYGDDNRSDEDMLVALERHPLRTYDPEQAQVFIISFLPGQILTWQPGKMKLSKQVQEWYDKHQDERGDGHSPAASFGGLPTADLFELTFRELLAHPIYSQYKHRHNHVLLSTALVTFHHGDVGKVRALARWYNDLQNITVAMSFDVRAMWEAHGNGVLAGNDYETMAGPMTPVTRSSFSLGLGCQSSCGLDLIPASMQRFDTAKHHIFYQTRTTGSLYNSTIYRHAPLTHTNLTQQRYPRAHDGKGNMDNIRNMHNSRGNNGRDANAQDNCMGYGLPNRRIWKERFSSSQFCLVIRGDTPHSHSLIRSMRVGCIPVIISDWYPTFSPTLKTSLPNMEAFAVFIGEKDFVQDPQGTLQALRDLPRTDIEEKIANLRIAQRIVFADHEQSLFVPAFVTEALAAMEDVKTLHRDEGGDGDGDDVDDVDGGS